MNLVNRMKASLLDGQYGQPKGIIGRMLGEKMVREHQPETTWTLSLLNLKPEGHVLELGFGAGKAIELAAAQVVNGQVAGIDLSEEMVRSASRRNSKAIKMGQVTLRQGNLTILPFADNRFDKVFTIQTLYFWPDRTQALAEIFRVLKPGATLVVTLSTGKTDAAGASGLEHYQAILQDEMIPVMKQLGFTLAYLKQGPASRQFKTTALIGVK